MPTSTESRSLEFREILSKRILVLDGAMGTMLYSKGVFINRCFDELNLANPELVLSVHQDYVKAGADILETNTFGANRARLSEFGLADKLAELNQAGVRLAREAAREAAFVAGSIGPLGVRIEPLGPTSYDEAKTIFREQADVLLEAGVDLLIIETFSNIEELRQAALAAREAAGPEMVVMALVTVDDEGRLMGGMDSTTFTRKLDEMPVDVIGCNCSGGPKVMLETLEKMMQVSARPMVAMPNAGLPIRVEGRSMYLSSPEYMAQYARRFIQAGVKLVGGCCGTTPDHIREICGEVRSLQPIKREPILASGTHEEVDKSLAPVALAEKSSLGAKLAAGEFVSFVEILPPRGVDPAKEIAGAKLSFENRIDCINVPDGPRASARMSAQATCQLIEKHVGIETVLHFCCRDRNILGIQSELLGAHAMGLRNLICITGDPPRMGTYPDATAVFDVDAIGLVNIVSNLNRGLDIGGNPTGSQTTLAIGVGANPGAPNLDEEVRRFEWKVEAGAEFVVTQPVFDIRLLENFMRRVEHVKIPLIAGIWPLTSLRNAEFMVHELRVPVPDDYLERMRRADTREKARAEGVAIARDMLRRVKPLVAGVQLSAPFGRYRMAIRVAEAIDEA